MRKFSLLVVIMGMTAMAISQTASPELVSSSGDSFNNSTYRLDWSIGECITATHSTGTYVITQGFHQDSYGITAIEDLGTDFNINAYPNPTTDLINLTGFENLLGFQLTVTDTHGKVLQQTKIINKTEQLNFSAYANGIYFLTVKQDNKLITSFKIIKN